MKNLTLGKRIGLGFTGVLLIAALLGGLAVWNMKSATRSARTMVQDLEKKFIPETELGDKLKDSVAKTALNIRSYGFTMEEQYDTQAKAALNEVKQQVQAAKALSAAHPDLVKLKEHLDILGPLVSEWDQLISQTEALVKNSETDRTQMNQSAQVFAGNMDKLLAAQHQKQAAEIKDFTEVPKLLERAHKVELLNGINSECDNVRIAAFKSQALRDPKLLEAGLKHFDAMDKNFTELKSLLAVPADIEEVETAQKAAQSYKTSVTDLLEKTKTLGQISAKRAELGDRIAATAAEFASVGLQRSVKNSESLGTQLAATSLIVIIGLGVALLVGIVLAFFISRSIGRILSRIASALNGGAQQVTMAAQQVSSSSQSLAEGSSEQAASIEETSASLEEMSSMTKRNADNSQQANTLAKQTRAAADKGVDNMTAMSAAMVDIKSSSDDVAKIIKTIDEIAFQTNILALNAAVEAARAGEAGMGFAVVADEVRNLAQRSAQAAKETAAKIEGAITKTAQGVQLSGKVSEALNEIVTKARQMDELAAEVANASSEQSQGIAQVNTAVGQMDKVTQSSAANAEECAAAAEQLNSQSLTMKESVNELLMLVEGTSLAGHQETRPPVATSATPRHRPQVKATGKKPTAVPASQTNLSAPPPRHEIPMEDDFKNF
jgi:methyl-accepting chemotaxis protein